MANDYSSLRPFVESVIRDTPQPSGSRWRLRLHPGGVLGHVDPGAEGAAMGMQLAETAGARARGKAKLFLECLKDGEVITTRSRTFINDGQRRPQVEEGKAMANDTGTAMQPQIAGVVGTLAANGDSEAAVSVARLLAESHVIVARTDADARVAIAGLDATSSLADNLRRMVDDSQGLVATLLANLTAAMEGRIEDNRLLGRMEAKLEARDQGAKDPTIMQEITPLLKPLSDAIGSRIARAGMKPKAESAELATTSPEGSQEPEAGKDDSDALAELLAQVATGKVSPEDGALAIGFALATRSEAERARMKALAESLARKL